MSVSVSPYTQYQFYLVMGGGGQFYCIVANRRENVGKHKCSWNVLFEIFKVFNENVLVVAISFLCNFLLN